MGTDRNLKAIYMTAVLKEQSRKRKLLPVVQNADNAIYWKNLDNDTNPLDIWFIWWVVVFDVWTTGARLLNYVFDISVLWCDVKTDSDWINNFSHTLKTSFAPLFELNPFAQENFWHGSSVSMFLHIIRYFTNRSQGFPSSIPNTLIWGQTCRAKLNA